MSDQGLVTVETGPSSQDTATTDSPLAAVRAHTDIADAAAIDLGGPTPCWLVARRGFVSGPTVRQIIKRRLAARGDDVHGLHVVLVDRLPRTEDGDIDQVAARQEALRSPWQYFWVPPTTPDERALGEMFEELIAGVDVSMTDDLTSLGGDSLLAAELVELIEQRTGRLVSASDLFAARDLSELARIMADDNAHE